MNDTDILIMKEPEEHGDRVGIPFTVGGAFEVLAGLHGINDARVKSLTAAGFDAAKVQSCVNDLIKLFKRYQ